MAAGICSSHSGAIDLVSDVTRLLYVDSCSISCNASPRSSGLISFPVRSYSGGSFDCIPARLTCH